MAQPILAVLVCELNWMSNMVTLGTDVTATARTGGEQLLRLVPRACRSSDLIDVSGQTGLSRVRSKHRI